MAKKIIGKGLTGAGKGAKAGLQRAAQKSAAQKKRESMEQFKEAEKRGMSPEARKQMERQKLKGSPKGKVPSAKKAAEKKRKKDMKQFKSAEAKERATKRGRTTATNIPKTGGNETVEFQRRMTPAGIKALTGGARKGVPELSAGAGPSTRAVYTSMQGARARGVRAGLPARIKEAKKFQKMVAAGTANPAEAAAAKSMRLAIKRDIDRFGISGAKGGKDFKSGSVELKDAKIMDSIADFAKGGLKKKKPVKKLAKGGFPDLTGDGKVTKKDVLKGRGVAMNKGGMKKQYGTKNFMYGGSVMGKKKK